MKNTLPEPLIVLSDRSLLLEVDHPLFQEARNAISRFAELEKCPEHIHTYRISPISLWNAASSGVTVKEILDTMERFGRYEIPQNIRVEVKDTVSRYGKFKLHKENGELVLTSTDPILLKEILSHKPTRPYLGETCGKDSIIVKAIGRGIVKQNLIHLGYPVEDLAGYVEGTHLGISLKEKTRNDVTFSPLTESGNACGKYKSLTLAFCHHAQSDNSFACAAG